MAISSLESDRATSASAASDDRAPPPALALAAPNAGQAPAPAPQSGVPRVEEGIDALPGFVLLLQMRFVNTFLS